MDKSLPFSFSNMELRNPQLALKPSSPLVKAKVSLKGWGELAKGGEDTTSCSPPAPLAHGSPLYHLPWPLPNPTLSSSLLLILYSQSLPYPELQSISLLWYLQMAKKLNKVMAWLALWVSSVCLMLFNRCLGGGDVISGAPGGLPLPPIRTVVTTETCLSQQKVYLRHSIHIWWELIVSNFFSFCTEGERDTWRESVT